MKKLSLVLLTMLVAVVLAACGGKDSKLKADHMISTTGHYDTLNYLYSSSATDSDLFANFVDGLVENDEYQRIVPSLAYKWEIEDVEEDGEVVSQTYTFHIRPGVQWVDKKFNEVAEVTAQDWIDAAQYILTPANNSQVNTLWFLFIENAENYYCGIQEQQGDDVDCGEDGTTDFADVGVKKIDKYTLQYTLAKPAPYFLTALTYNPFFPVNGDYLEEAGSDFGYDGDNILYNGGYVMAQDQTNALQGMKKNPKYWDAEHVYLETVLFVYIPDNAGTDWARLKYENGELTGFRLTENDQAGWTKYIAGSDGTGTPENPANPGAFLDAYTSKYTYFMEWNWGRENFRDSGRTGLEHAKTLVAMQNPNFRLGFLWGFDRTQYLQRSTPDDYTQWLRQSYMPRDIAEDVANDMDYVDYLAAEFAEQNPQGILDTDLFTDNDITAEIFFTDMFDGQASTLSNGEKVLDEDGNETDELLQKGRDLRFQPEMAKHYFELAKQELLAAGQQTITLGVGDDAVTHTFTFAESDFPIVVQVIGAPDADRTVYYNKSEAHFNNLYGADADEAYAEFDVREPANGDDWTKLSSEELQYDLRWYMGWGPDYADPATYLNTFVKGGDMLDYSSMVGKDALQEKVLGNFSEKVALADQETNIAERYRLMAEAEYTMLFEEALVIPFFSQSGEDVFVSKIKPYTRMDAPYGLSGAKYKNMIVLDEPVTKEVRAVLKEAYDFNNPARIED